MAHVIRGHYDDDGRVGDRDTLRVERRGDRWWLLDGSMGDQPIRAERHRVAGDLTAVSIVCDATDAEQARGLGFAWDFLPEPGECERVGMLGHPP